MFAFLNLKTSKIPRLSGVYFFKDSRGEILYIGKATNLRNRLRSYFSKGNQNARVLSMLKMTSKVDWQETDSEVEALILESQLIKKHRPQFNILMRDDKQYSYVVFTNDDFPKIRITHQPKSAENHTPSPRPGEPVPSSQCRNCLDYFLTKPDVVSLSRFSHQTSTNRQPRFAISAVKRPLGFLAPLSPSATGFRGRFSADFVGPFTDNFSLKSTLKFLRRIFPYCTCKEKHNNYCLNYHLENCPGYCCLKHKAQNEKRKTTEQNLKDYRKNIKAIKDVLSGKRVSLIKKLEKEMKEAAKKDEFIKAIGLRNKIRQLGRIFENARVIKQMDKQNEALRKLQKVFDLPVLPKRIEAYDISHIQGTSAVGSMVVFTDGKPDKNEYRKFKLLNSKSLNFKLLNFKPLNLKPKNSIRTEGDTGMLKEMLVRRFRHKEWPMPDLIIVDGGKAQLNAALETLNFKLSNLKSLNPASQTRIIALTKNKKHRPHKVITLSKVSPWTISELPRNAQNLLTSINSEAHRFAIGYHRKLRRQLGGSAS